MSWKEIPGWCEDEITSIYDMAVKKAKDGAVFVELGSYMGRSTMYMVEKIKESNKRISFYTVDTWEWDCHDLNGNLGFYRNTFADFVKNMGSMIDCIKIINMDSVKAANCFDSKSIDFLFIDTDHSYQHITNELNAWLPKMKNESLVAGHDYLHEGCTKAVNENFPTAEILISKNKQSCSYEGTTYYWNNSSWYYEKTT